MKPGLAKLYGDFTPGDEPIYNFSETKWVIQDLPSKGPGISTWMFRGFGVPTAVECPCGAGEYWGHPTGGYGKFEENEHSWCRGRKG